MPREAWSRLRDVTGEPIEIWADSGGVWLDSGGITVLDAAQREAFAQAWTAACWKAEQQARPVSDATEPPLHHDEGITGMHWDNLGSVGDG
jgi:hypothetical protein